MRKLIALLFGLVLLPAIASAQTGPYVYEVVHVDIPGIIRYTTATSSSGCTIGVHGCMASTSFSGASSISIAGPDADLASMPYPARVQVDLFDSGSNGTLACTAQTITGIDTLGQVVSESMGALSESGDTSATVFAVVTAYSAAGCSGGGASDVIRLSVRANEIGVPVYMASDSDVLSVGFIHEDDSSSYHTARSGFTRVGKGFAVEFGSATWEGVSEGLTDGARVSITVKGRRLLRFGGGFR